jgi:hypothetical protein
VVILEHSDTPQTRPIRSPSQKRQGRQRHSREVSDTPSVDDAAPAMPSKRLAASGPYPTTQASPSATHENECLRAESNDSLKAPHNHETKTRRRQGTLLPELIVNPAQPMKRDSADINQSAPAPHFGVPLATRLKSSTSLRSVMNAMDAMVQELNNLRCVRCLFHSGRFRSYLWISCAKSNLKRLQLCSHWR